MNIECNNIKDFCELISISVGQGIEKQCVFSSFQPSLPSVSFSNTSKDHHKFTYTFFTPLYTVIYKGLIKKDTFEKEYDLLKEICFKYEIHIHTFDNLSYNSEQNSLSVATHIEVI